MSLWLISQNALRCWKRIAAHRESRAHRFREGFHACFDDVVRVAATHLAQVQIKAAIVGECDKEFACQGDIELPYPFLLQLPIKLQLGATAKVHRAQHEHFIHRRDEETITRNAALVTHRFLQRLTEYYA